MTNINAQEYLNLNTKPEETERILINSKEKIEGDLIIEDYPNLIEIDISNQKLTSLTIVNCPALKYLNVRSNELAELNLIKSKLVDQKPSNQEISEIIAGNNKLTSLNLTYCTGLKTLIVPDNPSLEEIIGLNLTSLDNINIKNTSVTLGQETEELKKENDGLYEVLREIQEVGQEKKLILLEPIRTCKQAKAAIKKHLANVEQQWRSYFENEDREDAAAKNPFLDLNIGNNYEQRSKCQKTLIWVIEAQVTEDYEKLAELWNEKKSYNAQNDFDGSLGTLMEFLGIKYYVNESQKSSEKQQDLENYE